MLAIAIYATDAEARRRLEEAVGEGREMRIVGVAGNLAALRQHVAAKHADVVVADISELAQLNELAEPPRVPIVALVGDRADDLLDALYGGAHSALPRDAAAEEIRAAIFASATGLGTLPLSLLASLLLLRFDAPNISAVATDSGDLTVREIEVLAALADGVSNKAIARRYGISVHTVKFHVASILEKLGAESRTEAVAKAARIGLVLI
jgi:two-component system nitrate/nitrite response regulator NarL